jgi:hypothetical protein
LDSLLIHIELYSFFFKGEYSHFSSKYKRSILFKERVLLVVEQTNINESLDIRLLVGRTTKAFAVDIFADIGILTCKDKKTVMIFFLKAIQKSRKNSFNIFVLSLYITYKQQNKS